MKLSNLTHGAIAGEDICHVEQYVIVAKKVIVHETTSLWKAVASMITWYYIVDIKYPSECVSTLVFIENVLNLPMSLKMQNSAIQMASAIEHLDS